MEKYQIIKKLGSGSFGNVWQAMNTATGEVVAIKNLKRKYYSIDECLNMGEVKSLRRLNHPNIVKLKELTKVDGTLFFVFEYMESNLLQVIKNRRNHLFSESEVRNWMFQVFHGLAYMHQRGYFHRDLKPENMLVSKNVIKIADLGSAREIYSRAPYTEYITTRWYRAPEVMLKSPIYNWAVDMWAMGAIMAELFTLRPLFPGSSEADQMYKICSVMGTPTWSEWPGGLVLANLINYQFPQLSGVHLKHLIPTASNDAINLIYSLCSWDPLKRPTALQCLQHPFFHSFYYIPPSLSFRVAASRTYSDAIEDKSKGMVLMESEFEKLKLESKSKAEYRKEPSMKSRMATSDQKLARNCAPARSQTSVTMDLQRRLEMNIVDAIKNEYPQIGVS